jgi:hypothetical protein
LLTAQQWKVDPFTKEDNTNPFTEESSFATLFPKYREQYLRENWGLVTKALDKQVQTTTIQLTIGHCMRFGLGGGEYDCEDHKKDI